MMPFPASSAIVARRLRCAAAVACLVLFVVIFRGAPLAGAQTSPETIGRLAGDDVTVMGAVSYDVVDGRSTAVLASGNEVLVRSGQARIELVEGGEIDVCGPAHFTVFKSGGAITLALDYGRVRPMLDSAVPFTVYTPYVVATPVAVGQQPRDVTMGLDREGALCAFPARGAARIEQQLTGQSLLVPQGGVMSLIGGQLSAAPASEESCACDLPVARNSGAWQLELSVPVPPPVPRAGASPPPVLKDDQPVYMVYMPPLTFDAAAPAPPPPPDPQTILLVRESRLEPEVIFRGHVEPGASRPPAPSPAANDAARASAKSSGGPGLFARIFGIFRHHKERATTASAGSGGSGPSSLH